MAFSTKTIQVTSPTSTGNVAVTGVGFQPKALLFFATYQTAVGSAVNARSCIGMATSSSSRAVISSNTQDNVNPFDSDRGSDNTKCLKVLDNSAGTLLAADLVSLDADGFTLNWTTVQASGYVVYAVCLGGTDLTNVFIKEFTSSTGTGNQALTGVGFQPDAALFITQGQTSALTTGTFAIPSFGFCTRAASAAVGLRMENATTNAFQTSRTNKVITSPLNATDNNYEASLVSFDSDGFTINWSTAAASARYIWALCLKGGAYKVGAITQKTSTGTQATTGVGFQPTGLLMMSNGTTSVGVTTGGELSIGAGDSATSRFSTWFGITHASNPSAADMDNAADMILEQMTAGTPTTESSADLDSLDADGFTLDFTAADATARNIFYMAFGDTPSEFDAADPNCVLALEFEDNLTDLSGEGNNGTLAGDATYATGGVNAKCLTLDGTGDSVTVADAASLDITTGITVSAWIKRDGTLNSENGILSKTVYNFILNSTGKFRVELETSGYQSVLSSATVPADEWVHVCGTYDGVNIRAYINGVEDANSPTADTGNISTNNDTLSVGNHSGGYFPGEIDRVFVFNTAKSAQHVYAEYLAFSSPAPGGSTFSGYIGGGFY